MNFYNLYFQNILYDSLYNFKSNIKNFLKVTGNFKGSKILYKTLQNKFTLIHKIKKKFTKFILNLFKYFYYKVQN